MSQDPGNPYGSQTPPPIPPGGVTDVEPVSAGEEKNIAMLCHLLALTKYFTAVGHIVGPLIVWLWKKDQSHFVDEHGKESLNFQISMTIYYLISSPLLCVVIGFVVWAAIAIVDVVFVIIAALKAANGESYRYPLTIRFLK